MTPNLAEHLWVKRDLFIMHGPGPAWRRMAYVERWWDPEAEEDSRLVEQRVLLPWFEGNEKKALAAAVADGVEPFSTCNGHAYFPRGWLVDNGKNTSVIRRYRYLEQAIRNDFSRAVKDGEVVP